MAGDDIVEIVDSSRGRGADLAVDVHHIGDRSSTQASSRGRGVLGGHGRNSRLNNCLEVRGAPWAGVVEDKFVVR